MTEDNQIRSNVTQWLEGVVIAHNLCPFAKAPFKKGQVRICITEASSFDEIFEVFVYELMRLDTTDVNDLETTLLVMPLAFRDFENYLEALDFANHLIIEQGWEGVYQVASFHPDYQFEDTAPNDRSNFTNRAPYPIFHLIREDSMEKILKSYPDADNIPQRNIELMESIDQNDFEQLFYWKFKG